MRSNSQKTSTYRGRFAPSPTGPLHLGSLLAAVGSYLQAKRQHGLWLLRMEDIDPPREIAGAADDILRTLEAYGLYWDESVLYQSTRSDAYEQVLQQLKQDELLYACECSRKQISQIAQRGVNGYIYPGTCRHKIISPNHHAWRLIVENKTVKFNDAMAGLIHHKLTDESGDVVLKRADGLYAYQLAVVVDDIFQNISEVVRGNDLLMQTPVQLQLMYYLNASPPNYVHLPIIVNTLGQKLSKQTGALALPSKNLNHVLWSILKLLGQAIPQELKQENLSTIWSWAIEHWSIKKLEPQIKIPHDLNFH
ncbi:MAG: tRNA glutamyl-Q(34) synthetase GluQRS [Gammaproteobacteria bacterium]|nr:tRNA glutamyl-Q(34) synthetase GluQRS [Gammaproteobacteria bacterium]MDH5730145.1 tRNA glutamyl-Q(34) synthetase GluQRS [Gammaproteobacteria bacterium]